MNLASLFELKSNPNIPELLPGDTVKVSSKIVESGKERIQVLQGVVIKINRGGNSASFTVRHVAYGIGVERTFPFFSPLVEKVEIIRRGKVRRARLYYLRERSGKAARLKEKRFDREKLGLQAGAAEEELASAEEAAEVLPETPEQASPETTEAVATGTVVAEAPVKTEDKAPAEPQAQAPEAAPPQSPDTKK